MKSTQDPMTNIIFAGTPSFAAQILESLVSAKFPITAVLTQPDRPAGRNQQVQPSQVKVVATQHGLPIFQPSTLRDPALPETLAKLSPDVLIVVAYGLLLPKSILAIPKHGCINVHASLLPRWRGAAPIPRAILAGDPCTGISIMQMEEGLDTGDVLYQIETPIQRADTAQSLHDKLALQGESALQTVLKDFAYYAAHKKPQAASLATYAAKLTKAEAKMHWGRPAHALERSVRAYNPWPVAQSTLQGVPVRIWQATCLTEGYPTAIPGTILAVEPQGIIVATLQGQLRLTTLQLPGKKIMSAREVANGHPKLFQLGFVFS